MRLSAIRHVAFGRNPQFPELAGLVGFFTERAAPYQAEFGVEIDTTLPGNHNSYSYLSTRLLAQLTSEPPDLVVIAHALPDCGQSTSISGHVQRYLSGEPMIFAISEQGRTTAFTALRMALALARTGTYQRIAVLALDQGTIAFPPDPALTGLDFATDHTVGLLLTSDGRDELTALRQLTGISADSSSSGSADSHSALTAILTTELVKSAVPAIADRELVFVLGDGLTDKKLGGELTEELDRSADLAELYRGRYRIRQAPTGQLCTAVWSELARELNRSDAAERTVVAAEYDRELGYLSLLRLDVPSSSGTL